MKKAQIFSRLNVIPPIWYLINLSTKGMLFGFSVSIYECTGFYSSHDKKHRTCVHFHKDKSTSKRVISVTRDLTK